MQRGQVASGTPAFVDPLADVLQQAGALVICLEDVDSAAQAIENGFRPDAVVVDGTLPCAEALVAWVRRARELSGVPVLEAAPSTPAVARADGLLMRRSDIGAFVRVLDRMC